MICQYLQRKDSLSIMETLPQFPGLNLIPGLENPPSRPAASGPPPADPPKKRGRPKKNTAPSRPQVGPVDVPAIREVMAQYVISLQRSEALARAIEDEKLRRSALVQKLPGLGVSEDVSFNGQVYAVGRKNDTYFLRKVNRAVVNLGE